MKVPRLFSLIEVYVCFGDLQNFCHNWLSYSYTCLKRPLKGPQKIWPFYTGGLLTQVNYSQMQGGGGGGVVVEGRAIGTDGL